MARRHLLLIALVLSALLAPLILKKLDPGTHVIEVVAFDEEWNENPTPAKASFELRKR